MSDARYLAGLDIGSTGCKIIIYDSEGGSILRRVYRDCPIRRAMGAHEADANAIADTVLAVIQEAAAHYPTLSAIGVSSFGESFVLLDEADRPLLPIMLYTDPRGEEESLELRRTLGDEKIAALTGVKPAAMFSLPKLMWVKKHHPDVWAKVRRICLMEDYIVYLLTGKAQIDHSLAARTMAFDIHHLTWSAELLDLLGIPPSMLSQPVPTGTAAGTVRPDLAAQLGLDPHTLVVNGCHDQVAAAVGSGIFGEHCAVDGAGTVECITPMFTHCLHARLFEGGYSIIPYVIPGSYVCYAFTPTGGALVNWVLDNLSGDAHRLAQQQGTDVYTCLNAACPDQPTGLLVLPHFAGSGTPTMDSSSTGAIIGLTIAHQLHDIYRAVMEGVCYEMRLNLEALADGQVIVSALHATGGGARNRMWLQMKADVLGVPVTALNTADAGTTGSAMLAGIACGAFPDLEAAARTMVHPRETFMPRPDKQSLYEPLYQRYKKLHAALRPIMED